MTKIEIYAEMLIRSVSHARNVSTLPFWERLFDKSAYYELELVHNIAIGMLSQGYYGHDKWFLNAQAKWYLENCSLEKSPLYEANRDSIKALISLVPERERCYLELQL